MNPEPQSLRNETHATGLRLTLALAAASVTTAVCVFLVPVAWIFLLEAVPRIIRSHFFALAASGLFGAGIFGAAALVAVFRARSADACFLRLGACFFTLAAALGGFGFALFAADMRHVDSGLVMSWASLFAAVCFPLAGLLATVGFVATVMALLVWAAARSERRRGV